MAPKPGGKASVPVDDIDSQIIVSFNSSVGASGKESAVKNVMPILQALQSLSVTLLKCFVSDPPDGQPAHVVAVVQLVDPSFGLPQLRKVLKENPSFKDILHVERNAPVTVAATAFTDPLAGQQWALEKLGVTDTWTVTPPAGKTIVAIVDSGLRRHDGSVHEDLGSVEPVADCQPPPTATPYFPGLHLDGVDQEGHGTLLAGTISTKSNNPEGGIASAIPANWGISLLPVKFFSPGSRPNVADAIIAIHHALDMGANVINASWHVALGDDKKELKDAFKRAKEQECLVVVAAGNDGTNNEIYPTYPANYGSPGTYGRLAVLTVAATDRHDDKASFSNYGPNIVDLAAPGQDILTTGVYLTNTARYRTYHGTSASCAFVSAAAALVMALNRQENWKSRATIEHLVSSADTVARLDLAVVGGKRLNIARAVYGPLKVTAPAAGDSLAINTPVNINWTNDYDNPRFDKLKIEYSKDGGATWRVLDNNSANATGTFAWTPKVTGQFDDRTPGAAMTGIIRITPKRGNFPALSGKFKVV